MSRQFLKVQSRLGESKTSTVVRTFVLATAICSFFVCFNFLLNGFISSGFTSGIRGRRARQTDPQQQRRTLVVYRYLTSTVAHRVSLSFFIEHGLLEEDGLDYVFLVDSSAVPRIPTLPNVRVLVQEGQPVCWNGTVVQSLALGSKTYDYFILMSSIARGPFPPRYLSGMFSWVELLKGTIDNQTKLVGMSLNCTSHGLQRHPYVHPMLFAMDRVGLDAVLGSGALERPMGCGDDSVASSVSLAVLQAGYNIRGMEVRHAGIDFRVEPRSSSLCALPSRNASGAGPHPLEALFVDSRERTTHTIGLHEQWASLAPARVLVPEARRLRLHFVTHSLQMQGAPRVLLDLAGILLARGGYAVTVSSIHDGPLKQQWVAAGISVRILSDIHGEIGRAAEASDVVLLNTLVLAPVVKALPAHLKRRAVWMVHESEAHQYEKTFPDIKTGLLQAPARVLFVSHMTRSVYCSHDHGQFRTVLNWVDSADVRRHVAKSRGALRKRLGLSDRAFIVTSIGTFCERKDQMTLLRALRAVLTKTPELRKRIRLVLVGKDGTSPAYEQAMAAFITESKLGPYVLTEPVTDNVWPYLADSNLHTSTSLYESMPLNIMEAMAAGVPVVATGVYGVVELISHKKDGLLIAPRDSAMLAFAISRFAKHASSGGILSKVAAAGAATMAQRFSPARAAAAYDDLFRDVFTSWSHALQPPDKVCVIVRASHLNDRGFYTLEDTLRSLIRQEHPNWEALVVDVGSPQFTRMPNIIGQIGDPRIRFMWLGKHDQSSLEYTFEVSDRLITRCSPDAKWLVVTRGGFTYLPRFLSEVDSDADIVAVDFHGSGFNHHLQQKRGRLCERWRWGGCVTNTLLRHETELGANILNLERWRREGRMFHELPAADMSQGGHMMEILVYDEWRVKHVHRCLMHQNPEPHSCHRHGGFWQETTRWCITKEAANALLQFKSHFIYTKHKLPFTCIQEFHP
uniref:Glycosyl transferase group 1 n=1 Tax=Tetraselmis sp. GSL018 TaxID=582737 RepID=A0A061R598_9CHLO